MSFTANGLCVLIATQSLMPIPAESSARWAAGTAPGARGLPGGIEIFVLEGSLEDADGRYTAGSWLRLPDAAKLDARSAEGCILYVKQGAVRTLRDDRDENGGP